MKHEKKFYAFLPLALAETFAIVWFSVQPSAVFVSTGGFLRLGDLEHFIAYSVYGFLWSGVFLTSDEKREGREKILYGVIFPLVIGSAVGAACETMQLFVPTRVADVFDWLTDTLSSFFGAAIALKLKTFFKIESNL